MNINESHLQEIEKLKLQKQFESEEEQLETKIVGALLLLILLALVFIVWIVRS